MLVCWFGGSFTLNLPTFVSAANMNILINYLSTYQTIQNYPKNVVKNYASSRFRYGYSLSAHT